MIWDLFKHLRRFDLICYDNVEEAYVGFALDYKWKFHLNRYFFSYIYNIILVISFVNKYVECKKL